VRCFYSFLADPSTQLGFAQSKVPPATFCCSNFGDLRTYFFKIVCVHTLLICMQKIHLCDEGISKRKKHLELLWQLQLPLPFAWVAWGALKKKCVLSLCALSGVGLSTATISAK
jgi:hypothetical protein